MRTLKAIWDRWKVIAHKIGDFQARLLLSFFYFVVFAPFAFGLKIFSDPLRLRSGGPKGWLRRLTVDGDQLAQSKRQF